MRNTFDSNYSLSEVANCRGSRATFARVLLTKLLALARLTPEIRASQTIEARNVKLRPTRREGSASYHKGETGHGPLFECLIS